MLPMTVLTVLALVMAMMPVPAAGSTAPHVELPPASGGMVTDGIPPLSTIAYVAGSGGPGPTVRTIRSDGRDDALIATGDEPTRAPDGVRLAYACPRGTIIGGPGSVCLHDPAADTDRIVVHDAWRPRWSPVEDRIAFSRSRIDLGDAWVADLDPAGTTQLLGPGELAAPEWSPTGDRLLVIDTSSGAPAIVVIDADGTDTRALGLGRTAAWSPDGARVASTWWDEARTIVSADDLTTGTRTPLLTIDRPILALRWLPGDGLALVAEGAWKGWGELYVVELSSGTVRSLTPAFLRVAPQLTTSPSGQWLAFSATDGDARSLHLASRDGGWTRLGGAAGARRPVWQPWPEELTPIPGTGRTSGSRPAGATRVGERLFFTADDGIHGQELWRTDGTRAGTVMVRDLWPGREGSNPASLVAAQGVLFFVAHDGRGGRELWRSDGSAGGTHVVLDLGTEHDGGGIRSLIGGRGRLFFLLDDGATSVELWSSDGSRSGSRMLHRFPGWSQPTSLTKLGSRLFFAARDRGHGRELWSSDGTPDGTRMVRDIQPGQAGSAPELLTAVGSLLLFSADDGVHGDELWRSDGTGPGTRLVRDIRPGRGWSQICGGCGLDRYPIVGSTILLFAVEAGPRWAIWRSDGTAAGTGSIRVFGTTEAFDSYPCAIGVGGEGFWFQAGYGRLWSTDGTAAGTRPHREVTPRDCSGGSTNEALLFAGRDSEHGDEIWRASTAGGSIRLVRDIRPGPAGSAPHFLASVGGTVYVVANDGVHGSELWRSDGTASGTRMVKDINQQPR